jgi:ribonuclease J
MAADPGAFVYLARPNSATVALLERLIKTAQLTVVWSQWSGYLEKAGPVPAFLAKHAIEPLLVHSGGHAHPQDLVELVLRLGPKTVVPIHTLAPEQFSGLVPNVVGLEDGEVADCRDLVR